MTQDIYLASGKGIYFDGGTTSANYLGGSDAYEEGTWIPSLSASGSRSGTWDSTLTGTYTKIGRMVVVNLKITGSGMNFSAISGYADYTGLPFTIVTSGAGSFATPHSNGLNGVTRTPTGGDTFVLLASELQSTTGTINCVSTYFV